jgi:hypothetical protein
MNSVNMAGMGSCEISLDGAIVCLIGACTDSMITVRRDEADFDRFRADRYVQKFASSESSKCATRCTFPVVPYMVDDLHD